MSRNQSGPAAELITVGDELLSGLVLNSNASHIAHHLRAAGFKLRWITVVGDREDDISDALTRALERAAFVLVSGGLGPTGDDRTTAAVARALHRPLQRDPLSWNIISAHLEKTGISMTAGLAKMALLPEGARRIDLSRPRAGFYIEDAKRPLFCLPGVPEEMAMMLVEFVLPTLRQRFPRPLAVRSRLLRIFGLTESEIAQRLDGLEQRFSGLRLAYLPRFPENHLLLTAEAPSRLQAKATLEKAVAGVSRRLGLYLYGQGEETLEAVVGRLLLEKGHTLALAESCTGGLIAHRITSVPGSSAYFDCGMVTYSNAAKVAHLQVPAELVARHGAVSAQVAEAMVRGIQQQSQATMALAVTGFAGPSGGTPGKPVGTVYMALLRHGTLRLERLHFRGDRQQIKTAAAWTALDWLRRALIDEAFFLDTHFQPGQE